ncbi:MAG: DUF4091 domain-containing protein [Planctomycetota bacterium]|nr:DUF4091 domain-containing protein [Planctomycetota bacterium]
MVYPARDGTLRPTLRWERMRQGVNDLRLLALLHSTCASAGARGRDVWGPVQEILNAVRFQDTERDRRPLLSEERLDALREKIVDGLLELKAGP